MLASMVGAKSLLRLERLLEVGNRITTRNNPDNPLNRVATRLDDLRRRGELPNIVREFVQVWSVPAGATDISAGVNWNRRCVRTVSDTPATAR